MQWDDTENAGFTTGTPWLKVNEKYHTINVADQEKDPDSVLQYYRKLIALRKSKAYRELFTYGEFTQVYGEMEKIMAYTRTLGEKNVLVAANFGETNAVLPIKQPVRQILLSNQPVGVEADCIVLPGCGVIVAEI